MCHDWNFVSEEEFGILCERHEGEIYKLDQEVDLEEPEFVSKNSNQNLMLNSTDSYQGLIGMTSNQPEPKANAVLKNKQFATEGLVSTQAMRSIEFLTKNYGSP